MHLGLIQKIEETVTGDVEFGLCHQRTGRMWIRKDGILEIKPEGLTLLQASIVSVCVCCVYLYLGYRLSHRC